MSKLFTCYVRISKAQLDRLDESTKRMFPLTRAVNWSKPYHQRFFSRWIDDLVGKFHVRWRILTNFWRFGLTTICGTNDFVFKEVVSFRKKKTLKTLLSLKVQLYFWDFHPHWWGKDSIQEEYICQDFFSDRCIFTLKNTSGNRFPYFTDQK